MAQSYSNYKQNLSESEQKLLEIGQLVPPYQSTFEFEDRGHMFIAVFQDDEGNTIDVRFHRFKQGSNSFEVEFVVNGFSAQAFKTNTKHFFKINF